MRWLRLRRVEKRADEAWERAREADREQAEIEATWDRRVHAEVAPAREHAELNGWNGIARALIEGGSR